MYVRQRANFDRYLSKLDCQEVFIVFDLGSLSRAIGEFSSTEYLKNSEVLF